MFRNFMRKASGGWKGEMLRSAMVGIFMMFASSPTLAEEVTHYYEGTCNNLLTRISLRFDEKAQTISMFELFANCPGGQPSIRASFETVDVGRDGRFEKIDLRKTRLKGRVLSNGQIRLDYRTVDPKNPTGVYSEFQCRSGRPFNTVCLGFVLNPVVSPD